MFSGLIGAACLANRLRRFPVRLMDVRTRVVVFLAIMILPQLPLLGMLIGQFARR